MNQKYIEKYRNKLEHDIDYFSKENIEFIIDSMDSLIDIITKKEEIIDKQNKIIIDKGNDYDNLKKEISFDESQRWAEQHDANRRKILGIE